MTVVVNGVRRELTAGASVREVVELLGAAPGGVAVAVNEEVVPHSGWSHTRLHDGDRVEVLVAVQGG